MKETCCLVYALAPTEMSAEEADLRFNEFLMEERRGLPIAHDHFANPNGAFAVFHVRNEHERQALDDLGPLAGWTVKVHELLVGTTTVGFWRQSEFTLKYFRDQTVEQLASGEDDKPQYWWRRGNMESWCGDATRSDTQRATQFGSRVRGWRSPAKHS